MRGYIVKSVDDEYVLCLRSFEFEDMERVINKLKTSRQKELKALAAELEESLLSKELEKVTKTKYNRKKGG